METVAGACDESAPVRTRSERSGWPKNGINRSLDSGGGRREHRTGGLVSNQAITIEDRVLEILRHQMELDVEADTDVIETGLLDSLSFVTLLTRLETEFAIEIDVETLDLGDFRNPRAIGRYVDELRASGAKVRNSR